MINNPQSGLKCLKCGVTLSTVNSSINLMIEDYTANKHLHVCNPTDIKAHRLKESAEIKRMVKDVKIQQSEIMKSKDIINSEIMNIPMDAAAKLQQTSPQEVPQSVEFWNGYDPDAKKCCMLIDEAVKSVGWKSFVFNVLQYQLRKIKSNYRLLKSWK